MRNAYVEILFDTHVNNGGEGGLVRSEARKGREGRQAGSNFPNYPSVLLVCMYVCHGV